MEVVLVKLHGQTVEGVLDSGAVPNMMSPALSKLFSLKPLPTPKRITTIDGIPSNVTGALKDVPVTIGSVRVPLDVLVVDGTPLEVFVGSPALEGMQV